MGKADTISAIEAPSVRHMEAPKIQHQTTLAGPPVSSGVLNVVATDDTRPIIENANEIVAKFENSRLKEPVIDHQHHSAKILKTNSR